MLSGNSVTLELATGSEGEYIVKDISGITIGRIFILELSKGNRHCFARIKIYRAAEKSYVQLKDTAKLLLTILFKNMNMYKVNIVVDEEVNFRALTDIGFHIEGITPNTIITNNIFKDELIFGIDLDDYEASNKEKTLKLEGKLVTLKALTPEDAEDVSSYYIRNREHLRPYEPSRDESFYNVETQKKILMEGFRQFLLGTSINFGIYKDNSFIGKIQLSNTVLGVFKNAFVGYSMDVNEQGKGYMKDALKTVLKYSFEELGLHRIEASAMVENIKSQAVLKACGFKELGLNEKYLYINGEWKDHVTFYKLNE